MPSTSIEGFRPRVLHRERREISKAKCTNQFLEPIGVLSRSAILAPLAMVAIRLPFVVTVLGQRHFPWSPDRIANGSADFRHFDSVPTSRRSRSMPLTLADERSCRSWVPLRSRWRII